MPYLGVLGSNFKELLSYLKSAPSNFFYSKVWLSFLGIFVLEFDQNYCHI